MEIYEHAEHVEILVVPTIMQAEKVYSLPLGSSTHSKLFPRYTLLPCCAICLMIQVTHKPMRCARSDRTQGWNVVEIMKQYVETEITKDSQIA